MFKYSSSTGGFYDDGHPGTPVDAIEITDDEHAAVFNTVSSASVAMQIVPGKNGKPIVVTQASIMTDDQHAANAREQRNGLLTETDGAIRRHIDERELGGTQTLSDAQYKALLTYRKTLRDLPTQKEWPRAINWPIKPE